MYSFHEIERVTLHEYQIIKMKSCSETAVKMLLHWLFWALILLLLEGRLYNSCTSGFEYYIWVNISILDVDNAFF